MFWYEGRFREEGFVQCDFDGREHDQGARPVRLEPRRLRRPIAAHTRKGMSRASTAIPGCRPNRFSPSRAWSTTTTRCITTAISPGCPKDRPWVYATRIVSLPDLSEIQILHHASPPWPGPSIAIASVTPGCSIGDVLDNPDASPDGTKVLFNSNIFGQVDVYYVVARLPETSARRSRRTGGRRQ